MPYEIREEYDGASEPEYCVWKLPDEKMKCYNSKEDAQAFLSALNIAYQEEKMIDKSLSRGLSVKSVGDNYEVSGYGLIYGDKDLEGDTFTNTTDYMLDGNSPIVLYDHAQEIKSVLGKVTNIKADDKGLWMEAQLQKASDYAKQVISLIEDGKLGYSTGSVAHLVERLKGNIKRWPIYELSFTPTPAEPRTLAPEFFKSHGVVIQEKVEEVEATDVELKGKELKGDKPKSDVPERAEVEPMESNSKIIGDIEMSDAEKVVEETTEVAQPVAPAIDVEAMKAELNNSVQDAVKNALENEVSEKGGVLTEVPAVKARTEMGGDHDGGAAFMDWARTGESNYYTKSNLKAALQEGTATEGGVLVPQGLHESIIAKRDDLSVARAAGAMVIQTTVDSVQVPSENATGGFALTAEEGAANQDEPTFTSNAISVYKFTNLTKVSDELLADEKTNLEGFLGDMWGRSAADIENDMFLTGSGSGQPQGVIAGGTAALTLDSGTTIAASEVPELYYKLPGAYAQAGDSVAWAMNHATLGVIRGLSGNPFYFVPMPQGSDARGAGANLYGAPAYTSSHILSMAAGRDVVVIGNWKFYGLVERNEIVISRNPYLYQGNGQVGFFVNIRFGGAVLQSEAFQYATNAG